MYICACFNEKLLRKLSIILHLYYNNIVITYNIMLLLFVILDTINQQMINELISCILI